jgi:Protein of unknown function (DUF1153).
MYIKTIKGPRMVTLPDGSVMTRADLPPGDTVRWVASRKAAVVKAVLAGLIDEEEACARYALSPEEFADWVASVRRYGLEGLKATTRCPENRGPENRGPENRGSENRRPEKRRAEKRSAL